MKKSIIIFNILFILSLVACTNRIKKDEFENNYNAVAVKEISPDEFFTLRMHNRITIIAAVNYDIIKVTDNYVFIAKVLKEERNGILYSGIFKCKRKSLEEKFPDYPTFDGILADKIISINDKPYEPHYISYLKNDFKWSPELTDSHYVFHLKWNYSADRGSLVKRNFEILISKKNLNDVKVNQIFP